MQHGLATSGRFKTRSTRSHDPEAVRHQRCRASARRSIGIWTIDPAPVRTGFERIGYSNDGFGGTQRHHAIGLDASRKALEYAGLGLLVEIDQNVTTEDHVERADMGEILEQVELPVRNHGPD